MQPTAANVVGAAPDVGRSSTEPKAPSQVATYTSETLAATLRPKPWNGAVAPTSSATIATTPFPELRKTRPPPTATARRRLVMTVRAGPPTAGARTTE